LGAKAVAVSIACHGISGGPSAFVSGEHCRAHAEPAAEADCTIEFLTVD
jgi:hypothetical protein